MAGGRWRIVSGMMLVPAVMGGLAGCGQGGGHPAAATGASSPGGITAVMLRGALLTRVNGITAAAPPHSGRYASLSRAGVGTKDAAGAQAAPDACAGTVANGFDPAGLAAAPAAAVAFRVGTNAVSEVLIASSARSASAVFAGHVPAGCARYEEKIQGKTYTYSVREQTVAGVGAQAKVLNVHTAGVTSDNLWSLIYRGTDFVGTVTVVGPNASEKAVRELGQQAYAFAARTLP